MKEDNENNNTHLENEKKLIDWIKPEIKELKISDTSSGTVEYKVEDDLYNLYLEIAKS